MTTKKRVHYLNYMCVNSFGRPAGRACALAKGPACSMSLDMGLNPLSRLLHSSPQGFESRDKL